MTFPFSRYSQGTAVSWALSQMLATQGIWDLSLSSRSPCSWAARQLGAYSTVLRWIGVCVREREKERERERETVHNFMSLGSLAWPENQVDLVQINKGKPYRFYMCVVAPHRKVQIQSGSQSWMLLYWVGQRQWIVPAWQDKGLGWSLWGPDSKMRMSGMRLVCADFLRSRHPVTGNKNFSFLLGLERASFTLCRNSFSDAFTSK